MTGNQDRVPRSRIDGDRWDGETTSADPMRFRVRMLQDDLALRAVEVEALEAVYDASSLATDFPDGLGAGAEAAIAQWGDRYGGWGREARTGLA